MSQQLERTWHRTYLYVIYSYSTWKCLNHTYNIEGVCLWIYLITPKYRSKTITKIQHIWNYFPGDKYSLPNIKIFIKIKTVLLFYSCTSTWKYFTYKEGMKCSHEMNDHQVLYQGNNQLLALFFSLVFLCRIITVIE